MSDICIITKEPNGSRVKAISEIKKDYTNLYVSNLPYFGSNWSNSSNTGTFQLNVNNSASSSNPNITARLKFSKEFFHAIKSPGRKPGLLYMLVFITLPQGKT